MISCQILKLFYKFFVAYLWCFLLLGIILFLRRFWSLKLRNILLLGGIRCVFFILPIYELLFVIIVTPLIIITILAITALLWITSLIALLLLLEILLFLLFCWLKLASGLIFHESFCKLFDVFFFFFFIFIFILFIFILSDFFFLALGCV